MDGGGAFRHSRAVETTGDRRRLQAVGAAVFALATIGYGLHLFVFLRSRGADTTLARELAESFVHWAAWLAFFPLVLALARRVPVTSHPSSWAIHLAAAPAFSCAQIALRSAADQTLIHGRWSVADLREGFIATFGRTFLGGVVTYGAFILARETALRYRDQKAEAAVRERLLAETQLVALQNQLHPHFLFNTLNSIASLMHEDVEAANRMLVDLSTLLRALLDENGAPETTVERELALLGTYVAIEQARLADRLRFRVESDPAVSRALLPSLILQPLVENSIRHGITPLREGGSVEVTIRAAGERLCISIRDNGRGLPARWSESGIGIRNCRARLERLYGASHRFELSNAETGGAVVRIEIPLRFPEVRG
jgi:two-component system LytT family sensor kinase